MNGGTTVPKIQNAVDGRWMYNISNMRWVQEHKDLILRFADQMWTTLEHNNFHKQEWKNIYTWLCSSELEFARLVFIEWGTAFIEEEYNWSNGISKYWQFPLARRAQEMPGRQIYRLEFYDAALSSPFVFLPKSQTHLMTMDMSLHSEMLERTLIFLRLGKEKRR